MAVNLKTNSRLRFGDLLSVDDVEFWGILDLPTIPVQPDDIQYVVGPTDRIDTIAFKFYGDPVLWWVIALVNDLEFVPTQLNDGMTLRIPSPTYVQTQLFKKAKVT
jgi:hypothetical protein